jgi:hypothetical protein
MVEIEAKKQSADQERDIKEARTMASFEDNSGKIVSQQAGGGLCNRTGAGSNPNGFTNPAYIYAVGRINARFSSMGVEKEFAQATARAGKETAGFTDQKALHKILSDRDNRYLVRQSCWVFTIEGVDTYILQPRDPVDFDLLVKAIRPAPSPMDIDIVIGVRGPISPPEMCNGLMVPIVMFDQIYSFDRPKFIDAVKEKRLENMSEDEFDSAAEELFDRIIQLADNAGATDEHRALNYLALRYDAIYVKASEEFGRNFSLTAVEVRPSQLSGVRKIVDVIFSYTHRETDFTEKFFVRVDVTEEFPFLITKLSPYYNH